MATNAQCVMTLRQAWSNLDGAKAKSDYTLLAESLGAYAARSSKGFAAVVIPLPDLGASPAGRRASGCELVGHTLTHFEFRGRKWKGPAAALLCTNADLIDTFSVLASDILFRMRDDFSWQSLLKLVEEWQTLLLPKGKPSAETELGLWGELWFAQQSDNVDRMLAGWRGPESDAVDFFIDKIGVEVKTSQVERQHYISQSQVDGPVGLHRSWMLSLWVKKDPSARATVASLADDILHRAPDQGSALRQLAKAGFSVANRREYSTAYTLLSEPEWYAPNDIPRVRAIDVGISHLRYRAVLDGRRRANVTAAQRLWLHFHEREYGAEL